MAYLAERVTAWDIEIARRAYANAVLAGLDDETVRRAREWLEWLVARAKEQQ